MIHHNDFLGNGPNSTLQAFDNGLNNTFAFNYWDEWITPDSDEDGIVDDPYVIAGIANNQDSYPLAFPTLPQSHLLSIPKIISPSPGETLSGNFSIQWTPSVDSWGHSVHYSIFHSSDNGTTWTSLVTGLPSTSYQWDTVNMEDGSYLIKVVAQCIAGLTLSDVSPTLITIENQLNSSESTSITTSASLPSSSFTSASSSSSFSSTSTVGPPTTPSQSSGLVLTSLLINFFIIILWRGSKKNPKDK